MLVGMNLSGRTAGATVEAARIAEAAGIDFVTLGDSQATLRDVYCQLAACAVATERIRLGPLVTNPVTRHPTVTASAIATVDEISGGRAFLAIGRGNASVVNAGLPRPKPRDVERALRLIDAAMGRAQQGPTEIVPIQWTPRRVPVLVHGGGPSTVRIAVEAADGLIFKWGDTDPSLLAGHIEQIRRARAGGPRAAEPFQVWSVLSATVTDDAERARRAVDLSYRAHTMPIREWPRELADRVRVFHERYSLEHHASKTNKTNQKLMDELGLSEFILARYAAIGDVATIARQLRYAARCGVDAIVIGIVDEAGHHPGDGSKIAQVAAIRTELHRLATQRTS